MSASGQIASGEPDVGIVHPFWAAAQRMILSLIRPRPFPSGGDTKTWVGSSPLAPHAL